MNVRSLRSHVVLLALTPMLAACLTLERPYPEKRYYRLGVERTGEKREATPGAILRVSTFDISPAFQGRELAYLYEENRGEADFYNQLYLSPASHLTMVARAWLSDSGIFEHVVPSSSLVEANLVLEGSVSALLGDYRDRSAPKAWLKLQFLLLRDDATGAKIVLQKDYEEIVPISESTPRAQSPRG